MSRYLPDADMLVLEVIRGYLPGQQVGNVIPADLANRLPYVTAIRVSGPPLHPRFAGGPTVDVQTWASTRRGAADLAESVRVAFYEAWRSQTVYPSGAWVAFQRCLSEPAEIRATDSLATPQDLYRFQASYRLVIRR